MTQAGSKEARDEEEGEKVEDANAGNPDRQHF